MSYNSAAVVPILSCHHGASLGVERDSTTVKSGWLFHCKSPLAMLPKLPSRALLTWAHLPNHCFHSSTPKLQGGTLLPTRAGVALFMHCCNNQVGIGAPHGVVRYGICVHSMTYQNDEGNHFRMLPQCGTAGSPSVIPHGIPVRPLALATTSELSVVPACRVLI